MGYSLNRVYLDDLSKSVNLIVVTLGIILSSMGYESKKDSTKSGIRYIVA